MTQIKLPQDQYITVNSIKTRYWSIGSQGKPLILLHGGGSSIDIWTQNLYALAKHHQVYAFDMVGSGLSDKPMRDYSLEYQVQFLREFMDTLCIRRASLIGSSMGGSVALKFALESPKCVEKIVLVSSFGLGRHITIYHRLLAGFPMIANLAQPSRIGARLMLNQNVYDRQSILDEWIEISYKRFKMPGRKQALISLLKTNLNFWGVRSEVFSPIVQQINRIQSPTLIVWGKQDSVLPVAHAYIAAERIPKNSLRIFDKCGHWAHVEYSKEFNQLVLDFLEHRFTNSRNQNFLSCSNELSTFSEAKISFSISSLYSTANL